MPFTKPNTLIFLEINFFDNFSLFQHLINQIEETFLVIENKQKFDIYSILRVIIEEFSVIKEKIFTDED